MAGEGKGLISATTLQLFLVSSVPPGRGKLDFHNVTWLFI